MNNTSLSNPTPNSIQVKMLKGSLKNIPLPPEILVVYKHSLSPSMVLLFRLIFVAWYGSNKEN